MSARPEDSGLPQLRDFFSRTERRRTALAVVGGASVGFGVAMVAAVAVAIWRGFGGDATGGGLAIECGSAAIVVALSIAIALFRHRRAVSVARAIEARAPQCRNVVITAAELADQPARVQAYIGTRVSREAERLVAALDPATLFPARRAVTALGLTSGLYAVALLAGRPGALATLSSVGKTKTTASAVIRGVDITVTAPAYTGLKVQTFHDPTRVDAFAGSTVLVSVHADAGSISLETVDGHKRQAAAGEGQLFTASLVADADGYIALEPETSDGHAGIRRLIGLTVTPDLPPRVKVTAPGHDLLLANAHKTLDVVVEGSDDLGLATLKLRYTKVSGSGEQFKFTDGEVPLQIARANEKQWTGKGSFNLDALGLAPGDMVVYRGVATDKRPGAPPSESDNYIVEIATPGSTPMEGFSADDRKDKYGLSQQMVILKTEQLIARRKTIPKDSLDDQLSGLSAEQRSVRAEFVFMMGGELAEEVISSAGLGDLNETAEAEAEGDIAAGRLANQGRVDLVQAIRSMSQASTSLNDSDADKALVEEKTALTFLLRAFSRARYILRALTERERLDLSRRLTGVLSTVVRDVRAVGQPNDDPRLAQLRRALADVATAAGQLRAGASPAISGNVSLLAQRVLQIDPAAEGLQHVAATLNDAAAAIGKGRADEARPILDRAAVSLAGEVRAGLLEAPGQSAGVDVGRLDGALTDALRHGTDRGPP